MLYYINPEQQTPEELKALLEMHPEIKFVSFMGVDFAGNDTDEKVPINLFIEDINSFLEGMAAQTDGSSVVLPGIATLNNARVDMKVDKSVNWYIDYNYEHFDAQTGKMVGTLRIPCFLIHNEIFVDSRSILQNSLDYVEAQMLEMFKKHPQIAGLEHVDLSQIEKLVFTCATELEFWVKSPREDAPIEALSSSQMMQEQYWQRTRGNVRTALEQTIEMMEAYGLEPEMGHKECGGVRGQIDGAGHMTHVMEQLEVDWKFNVGLQTADNELLARIIVKEVFRMNGLEVSFQAKPIPGVAGSGEHTHVGIAAKLKNGKMVNLFAPGDMKADFLSAIGYGSMMGLLKNYEDAVPKLQRAAKQGEGLAMAVLGDLYAHGRGVKADRRIAMNMFAKGIQAKCPLAHCYRGEMYQREGKGEEAMAEYQKAFQMDSDCMYALWLTTVYHWKSGQYEMSVYGMDLIYNNGVDAMAGTLGMIYAEGKVVPVDYGKAFDYLTKDEAKYTESELLTLA